MTIFRCGTTTKICPKCVIEKSLDEFAEFKVGGVMTRSWCRSCQKKDLRIRARTPRYKERRDKYWKDWYYFGGGKEYTREYMREYRQTQEGEIKRKTRRKMNYLLENRLLQKEPCKKCGSTNKIQAHHSDYLKPLEIEWLCSLCHTRKHLVERIKVEESEDGKGSN